MTAFIFENFINTTLAGAISNSATTMTLSSNAGLPSSIPSGSVLVFILNDFATRQNYEIVYATSVSGATLTIERAQEGTAALAWSTNDYAYSVNTAGQMASVNFGRLLGPPQIFTNSGTYTPTPGTNSIIVEVQGGGGGGGGSPSTGTSQQAQAEGGQCGAYGKGYYTSGFDGATVTVGTAGAGGTSSPSSGGSGGTSSLGALLSAPGGAGGAHGALGLSGFIITAAVIGSAPSGANLVALPAVSGPGIVVGGTIAGSAQSGTGGSCPFGVGGVAVSASGGNAGSGYGSGGSGASQVQNNPGAGGGNGAPGIIIIWEYS